MWRNKLKLIIAAVVLTITLAGCVEKHRQAKVMPMDQGSYTSSTSSINESEIGANEPARVPPRSADRRRDRDGDVYHVVEPGQNLYRICKTYGVSMEAVAKANNIEDVNKLEVGQRLLIPGAGNTELVEPAAGSAAGNEIIPSGSPVAMSGSPDDGTEGGAADNSNVDDGYIYRPDAARDKMPLEKIPSPNHGMLDWPVPSEHAICSPYGNRHGHTHDGVDFCAPVGTPVVAAADGKVTFSDKFEAYGNMIIVKHAGNLSTIYAHNKKNLVKVGDIVHKGQQIAELGETGRAQGANMHFEVRVGSKSVNPAFYLP